MRARGVSSIVAAGVGVVVAAVSALSLGVVSARAFPPSDSASGAGKPTAPKPGVSALAEGEEVEGRFEIPADQEPGEAEHLFRLPENPEDVPWRLVVSQSGIDVRVLPSSGGEEGVALNYHLDRYEEEVFRLDAGVDEIAIRPVRGGERQGAYRLRLELPLGEDPARRRLELLLTEAAGVKHGAEAPELRRAAELYERAAGLAREPTTRARALLGAANHRRVRGEGPQAEALYREATALWRTRGEEGWLAASLVGAGQSARRAGRLEEAREALEEALALWRGLEGRETEAAQTESGLGLVAHVEGDYPRALGHYHRSLEHHRASSRQLEVANVSLNLGSVYSRLGDAEAALEHQTTSLELFRRIGDQRGELDALNSLAALHRRMAEFEPALALFGRSRSLAADLRDRRLEGRALNNRGWVYLGLGQLEQAVADLELGSRLAAESGDARLEIAASRNLAESFYLLGRFDEARRHWLSALERARSRDHREQIVILGHLGRLEARLGENDGGEGYRGRLEEAWALHAERGHALDEARLLTLEGEAHLFGHAPAAALEPLTRARHAWQTLGNPGGEILALTSLGQTQRALGRPRKARDALEEAVRRIEGMRIGLAHPDLRAAFLAARLTAYELLIETLVDLDREEPGAGHASSAFEVAERARARRRLDHLLEPEPESSSPEVAAMLAERRRLSRRLGLLTRRQELVALGRQKLAPGEDLGAASSELRAELDVLETRLRRAQPRRAVSRAAGRLGTTTIRQLLDADTTLLHYFLGEERSHLWVLHAEGLHHVSLPPRRILEAAARRLHRAWSEAGSRRSDAEAASALARRILDPVAAELRGRRLAVLADGALHYVPLAGLPLPGADGDRSLLERFEIVRLDSAAVLAAERARSSGDPGEREAGPFLAVLADPVFHPSDPRLGESARGRERIARLRGAGLASEALGRLPGSGVEARAISAHLPPRSRRLVLGFDASADALSRGLENASIVHFATHGVIDTANPELSGLVLAQFHADGRRRADGFLPVHEIQRLRLAAELVVLSGCSTALGKELRGEAFLGLASSFLQAGAHRVMASLWSLADRATAELMADFYRALLADGLAPAAALREAQLRMARDRRYADPYYWAGFVIQGDWLGEIQAAPLPERTEGDEGP